MPNRQDGVLRSAIKLDQAPSSFHEPPRSPARSGYLFRRSAAVLGSSNVSAPNAPELGPLSPASNAAAPETGALRQTVTQAGRRKFRPVYAPNARHKSRWGFP